MSKFELVTECGEVEKELNVIYCKKNTFKDEKTGVERTSYTVKTLSKAEMTVFEDGQIKSLGSRDAEIDFNSDIEIPKGHHRVILKFNEYRVKETKEQKLSRKIIALAASAGSSPKKAV